MNSEKRYIAIDLKSFYASVECIERNLDPLSTNLVVADESRTEKTICLAVTPSLKSYGISGRPRLFEVVSKVKEINGERLRHWGKEDFTGETYDNNLLNGNPGLKLSYIVAEPRMAYYIEYSTKIYQVYMTYISPEDIHVYSIDEVFIDITPYLNTYKKSAYEIAEMILEDVVDTTGITATAGIGTNLYLSKIAMDIMAKHMGTHVKGGAIAELDEISYRRNLWTHKPLTDFWRIGRGYEKKLNKCGIYTMGDIARCSIGKETDFHNSELLYKQFGVNAELLIDHAWGYEPCELSHIRSYTPENKSIYSSQVLSYGYTFSKAKLVIKEMADALSLDLVDKGLVTDQLVINVRYDGESLKDEEVIKDYKDETIRDVYGRRLPKHGHGTVNFYEYTNSSHDITEKLLQLYESEIDNRLLIRKISISANRLKNEGFLKNKSNVKQLSFFSDEGKNEHVENNEQELKEKKIQRAMLDIKKKFGKNAILKGMSFEEDATTIERNQQIGGHKA